MFLGLPAKAIGQIGGGKSERTGLIDIAVIQSLYRKDAVKDFVAEYGQVIVDECHHVSAFTFEQVMKQVKAKYVIGLNCNAHPKGWPSPNHPHAVRSNPLQHECADNDANHTF